MPVKRATLFNARTLLARLGVTSDTPFGLADVITPVSLVDTDVPLTLTEAVLGTPATAGELVAPAANTVLADSGAQAADNYFVTIMLGQDTAGAQAFYRIQHRDAANAANIWSQLVLFSTVGNHIGLFTIAFTKSLSQGERIRILNGNVIASTTVQANVFLTAV